MISNLIFPLRRRWPILVVLPLLSVAFAWLLTPKEPPAPVRWEAGVYLAATSGEADAIDLKQTAIDIKQPEVAELAAKKLDKEIEDPKRFAAPLKVRSLPESLTIRLSYVSPDKDYAYEYVKAFADATLESDLSTLNVEYVEEVKRATEARDKASDALLQFQLDNAAEIETNASLRSRLEVLERRLETTENTLLDLEELPVESKYRLQDADETTRVAKTKLELPSSRPVRTVLALFLGILGGIAVAAFVEKLNPRVDRPDDAERITGAPVLAMVPVLRGKSQEMLQRASLADFSGPFAESFRALRSHLDFRSTAEGMDRPPCVMIVSSAPGEGKTTSTAFLALSYAEVGRDVVVVGGDFRRPAVHRLFGLPRSPGLSTRLLKADSDTRPEEIVSSIVKRDSETGVRVIPSGPGTDRVTGLLGDMAAVTAAGLESGCTVVIDTAPVMVANDAIDYLPIVDWVVIVIRLGKTTERSLRQTISTLELNNARVAGCVMVGSLESADAKRYYYSYYRVDEQDELLADRQVANAGTDGDNDEPDGERIPAEVAGDANPDS